MKMDQIIAKLEQTTISTVSSLDIESHFVNNLNQIFSFDDNNDIKVIGTIDKPWFRAKDVLKILGYSDNKDTNKKFIQNNIPEKYKKSMAQIIKKFGLGDDVKLTYNETKEIYLTKNGLEYLLGRTTKLNIDEIRNKLIKQFNLNLNVVYETKEQKTLGPICKVLKKVFPNYECILQYGVLNYKLDLYIPELKFAIECDEFNHIRYDKEKELQREKEIREDLDCTFFRYNPNSSNFDIFETIGELINCALKLEKN